MGQEKKKNNLKKFRIIIAIFFFLLVTLFFVDIYELIPNSFYKFFLSFQFFPSLLKIISSLSIFSLIGLTIVFIFTFLFGRVYCSFICPTGVLQDLIIRISKKLKIKRKFKYSKESKVLRYLFFILFLLFIISGTITLVGLFDPYSIYGRISSNIFLPLITNLNNGVNFVLEKFNYYGLRPITYKTFVSYAFIVALVNFSVLLVFAIFSGRSYCNTICPVGTFLGLISRLSIYKIAINKNLCTSCGKCSVVCKSNCIDFKNKKVDFDRCVVCFNCFGVCDFNGIGFNKSIFRKVNIDVDSSINETKREFLLKSFVASGSLLLSSRLAKAISYNNKNKILLNNIPIIPPGASSIEHLNNYCTACHLCVSICPTKVLQPSVLEMGLQGFLQPHLDYSKNYCHYECNKCSQVCPTGAIRPISLEEKKLTQIGVVHFEMKRCIVYTDETSCGSCSEHCPTQAVTMVDYKDGLTIPKVIPDICIGCGACEYACPVRPIKAIYVVGNKIHNKAKPPKMDKPILNTTEDFPF